MMRILVLGASGMLGRPLSDAMANAGHTCLAHGNSAQGSNYLRANLLEPRAIARLLNETKPDAVINLVALTNVDACENDLDLAYRLNVGIPDALSQAAGPDIRVIQLSTDHVYDGSGDTTSAEVDTRLTNVYALTKRAGELPVLARGGVVLRTNFFGPSNDPRRISISDTVRKALSEGTPFFGFNDVYYNPLSMTRLSAEILRAATSWHPGLYNLGAKTVMSKLNFARQVAMAYGLNPELIGARSLKEAGLTAPRPLGMAMDVSAFERAHAVTLPSLEDEISTLEL